MFKKRNDEPDEPAEPQTPETLSPKVLPPFRTWSMRSREFYRLDDGSYLPNAFTVYEAHMIDINAAGFVVFSVYFRHPESDQLMQAPRYFLNPSEWAAIEEINVLFSEPLKH